VQPSDYFYELPANLIPGEPVRPADHCRLLHAGYKGDLHDLYFKEIERLFLPGDVLVVNDSGVEPRRIYLERIHDRYHFESVFLRKLSPEEAGAILNDMHGFAEVWQVLLRKSKKLKMGDELRSLKNNEVEFTFLRDETSADVFLAVNVPLVKDNFFEMGEMPIPPYMHRSAQESDLEDYQNYFARNFGSVAAPTAALHFTENIERQLRQKGVQIEPVTLHIGYGTFAPLTESNIIKKELHTEVYSMPEKLAGILAAKNYNRVIALGTTSMRVLETVARQSHGRFDSALQGETKLFLAEPDKAMIVDGLITNFHVPESSLMMLVGVLLGREKTLAAYRHAVNKKYRFLSYGDAMMII
jgi:S-adenosylmethionine:tRNA ribosyltransferase-isomerase